MSLPPEQIQALAETVSTWRMQEYISISFFAFYVYYVLTTVDEEVSVIFPQRWNCGKILFNLMRYGTVVFIAMQLSRDYRNYFDISPNGCKALDVFSEVGRYIATVACEVALGLCLSALLQLRMLYMVPLTILCAGPIAVESVIGIVSRFQIVAVPISPLDEELGYPCYFISDEEMSGTISANRPDIRSYVESAASICMVILVVATLVVRYKGHKGRLVQVLHRDGIAYYAALAVFRFAGAITTTPAIIPIEAWVSSPLAMVQLTHKVVVPILAQRILLNIRQADRISSRPVASTLLFAPPPPDSEEDVDSFEMDTGRTGVDSSSGAPSSDRIA